MIFLGEAEPGDVGKAGMEQGCWGGVINLRSHRPLCLLPGLHFLPFSVVTEIKLENKAPKVVQVTKELEMVMLDLFLERVVRGHGRQRGGLRR